MSKEVKTELESGMGLGIEVSEDSPEQLEYQGADVKPGMTLYMTARTMMIGDKFTWSAGGVEVEKGTTYVVRAEDKGKTITLNVDGKDDSASVNVVK